MNKLKLIVVVVLISLTFYSIQKQTKTVEKSIVNNGFIINDAYYTLHFNIENKTNQKPVLVIAMELKKEAHYISPFAKIDFKGKFFYGFRKL